MGETISLNIGTPDSPKNVNIGAQCTDEEKLKFTELLREFQDVFAWSYEDIHGFDPALIQDAIPIKEGIVKILCNCKEYSYPLLWIKIKYIYY